MITENLDLVARLLREEEVVAVPTETVYGLAGNAFSSKAVGKIFEIKQRPFSNPLIVHLHSADQLSDVACRIPDVAYEFAKYFWPGPLTMVLHKKKTVPDLVTAGNDTVAVRVPAHPVLMELMSRLEFPLAAPSANMFGHISPTTASHVENSLGMRIKAILDGGPCEYGLESTIIGFIDGTPVIYRKGAVTEAELACVDSGIKVFNAPSIKPVAPGMLPRHYAPRTKTVLSADLVRSIESFRGRRIGVLSFGSFRHPEADVVEILSASFDLQEAARNLYAAMHRLDESGVDLIVVEQLPETGLGSALNDRLRRAVVAKEQGA